VTLSDDDGLIGVTYKVKSVCCDREEAVYRYEVTQIRRLSSIENFVSERDDFIFNSFSNFFRIGVMCWNFGAWTTVRAISILDVLETIYLKFRKII